MPFNWLLEVEKWRISVPHEKLTFHQSMSGVLSGLALNWVLPFTLGDVSGRLAGVINYKKTGAALLLNRALSLGITLIFGGCSVLFYWNASPTYFWILPIGFIVLIAVLKVFYKSLETSRFVKILVLAITRYLIFTIQFALIIYAFIPALSISVVILGIGWVFLFRSLIPSLFGNFGVREASALMFFESFLDTPSLILFPCLLVWVINTVLPSIVGVSYIFKLKFNIAR